LPFLKTPAELNESVDAAIRAAAARKHPQPVKSDKVLRLWWGITGQKRSWIEQEQGSAYILDALLADYPNLELVFDGWTCPIDPGEGDAREMENDEAVVAKILSQMQHPVKSTSVIGKTSLEKVAVAMTCDAFVANFSTGSMHVSRFADRPGVLHINTRLLKSQHIQRRAVTVPAFYTKDVVEGDDQRADFVSYSIEPDVILMLLRGVIEAGAPRWLR
jgi:hypothetical protein